MALSLWFSWQRSIFTLSEPVCCLFASRITYLWNVRVISFSRPLMAYPGHQSTRPQSPSLLSSPPYHLCTVNVNYWPPALTNVKETSASLFYYSFSPRGFPTLLSLTLLAYHQWILWILLTFFFIIMYKISCTTAILQSIFSICWDFASWQLSVWIK